MESSPDRISPRNFERLGRIIESYCGIRMPPAKKTMVEGRLRRRARNLDMPSLDDYCAYLLESGGLEGELVGLIDAVTTNKTDFFREPEHFKYLLERALPDLAQAAHRPGRDRPLKVWSAASSIGAEPYTIAMLLAEHARTSRAFQFDIVATDICTEVLEQAKLGIYPEEMAAPVPAELRRRYLRRSRDRHLPTVRLIPDIRRLVRFGRLNLMDDTYGLDQPFDIVFCRNILIYFDKGTQLSVLSKICGNLRPGGYLFVGHSETVGGLGLPLHQVATAVFQRS